MKLTLERSREGRPPASKKTFKNASGNASIESSYIDIDARELRCQTFQQTMSNLAVEREVLLEVRGVRMGGTVRVLAIVPVAWV